MLNFTFYNCIDLRSHSLSITVPFFSLSVSFLFLLPFSPPSFLRFLLIPSVFPSLCSFPSFRSNLIHDPLFPGFFSLILSFLFILSSTSIPFLRIPLSSSSLSLLRLPVRERRVVRGPAEPVAVVHPVVHAQHRAVAGRPGDGHQTSCRGASTNAHAHASCRDDVRRMVNGDGRGRVVNRGVVNGGDLVDVVVEVLVQRRGGREDADDVVVRENGAGRGPDEGGRPQERRWGPAYVDEGWVMGYQMVVSPDGRRVRGRVVVDPALFVRRRRGRPRFRRRERHRQQKHERQQRRCLFPRHLPGVRDTSHPRTVSHSSQKTGFDRHEWRVVFHVISSGTERACNSNRAVTKALPFILQG